MPYLLIDDSKAPGGATIGGRPSAPAGTQWPTCPSCKGPMQFIAQLPLDSLEEAKLHGDQTLLLFQCQNDPGMCDEWDADAGGNAALLVGNASRVPMPVPAGETLLPEESRLRRVEYVAVASQEADDIYLNAVDAESSPALSKLGGVPLWLQNDETPACDCGASMTFVAQLEWRGGGGINFGDCGTGYAFVCSSCRDRAKFLWQC